MKFSVVTIILICFLASCHSANNTTDAKSADLIPGTQNPTIKECTRGKAYIYDNYEIHVEPSPEQLGMNIFLYKPTVSQGNPCNLDRTNASHIIGTGDTEGNNFFAGLYDNYLFVDQGTSPDQRILSIYDLSKKKLILFTEYSDPILKNGTLTYYKTLVPDPGVIKNIHCPKAAKWTEQGLTVLYEEKETFNLKSEIRLPNREYRCRAGQ